MSNAWIHYAAAVYYASALAVGIGCTAIIVRIASTARGDTVLGTFLLFYIAFTIDLFLFTLGSYLAEFAFYDFLAIMRPYHLASSFFRFFLMASIAVMGNELLPVETRRVRNSVFGLIALGCFVYAGLVGVPTVEEGRIVISMPDRVRVVDFIFIATVVYTLTVGITKMDRLTETARGLIKRIVILIVLFLPVIVIDNMRIVYGSILLSPLLYCALSLTVLEYLLRPSFRYIAATGNEVGEAPAATSEERLRHVLDPHALSEREMQTAVLAAQGFSNRQIGEELFVSIPTVKSHLYSVYKKSGIRSRYQLSALLSEKQSEV